MDYIQTQPYGITVKSIEFVREHLPKIGSIVKIECFLVLKEQWTAFMDDKGDRIVVSGFSWGYIGEGSRGLLRMAQELGFDLDIKTIAHHTAGECWTISR